MKNKHVNNTLEALHAIDITTIEDQKDQFAIIDNVIALSDTLDVLIKAQKEAIEKFRPKNFESLKGVEREEATVVLNKKLNDYLEPRLEADVPVKLKTLSESALTKIVAQKNEITTAHKALIIRFFR